MAESVRTSVFSERSARATGCPRQLRPGRIYGRPFGTTRAIAAAISGKVERVRSRLQPGSPYSVRGVFVRENSDFNKFYVGKVLSPIISIYAEIATISAALRPRKPVEVALYNDPALIESSSTVHLTIHDEIYEARNPMTDPVQLMPGFRVSLNIQTASDR